MKKIFEYFDQTSEKIKEIIKEEGESICEDIGVEYIKERLKDFNFGFIVKLSKGKEKEKLHSFVLCKHIYNSLLKNIEIILVCSRHNSKDFKQLLELIENKAKNINYECLSLNPVISNSRKLNWYISQGFILETYKSIPKTNLKSYYIRKILKPSD